MRDQSEHYALLWDLVELLLAEVVEHAYHGDSRALYQRLSPEGRRLLDDVAAQRRMERVR